jgi:hypothetical protein
MKNLTNEVNTNAIILILFGFALQTGGFGGLLGDAPWTMVMWTVWALGANRIIRAFL